MPYHRRLPLRILLSTKPKTIIPNGEWRMHPISIDDSILRRRPLSILSDIMYLLWIRFQAILL